MTIAHAFFHHLALLFGSCCWGVLEVHDLHATRLVLTPLLLLPSLLLEPLLPDVGCGFWILNSRRGYWPNLGFSAARWTESVWGTARDGQSAALVESSLRRRRIAAAFKARIA